MDSYEENSHLTHSRCKYSRGQCAFHPDAVTAKTISRLSQGVARLTANDSRFSNIEPGEINLLNQDISGCWNKSSDHSFFGADPPSDASFGLYTQRSSVARVRLSLPTLNAGSKRIFSYVIGSSRPLNMSSCRNSLRDPRDCSFQSRFPYPSGCDVISSDSSMLSITPPRSVPTASSSPVITSSADDSQSRCQLSTRHRRWRKRRKTWWHSKRESHRAVRTDCQWNSWRSPLPLLGERNSGCGSVHRLHRKCDIFNLEDSSEEGPLKKSRVTEKVFESTRECCCSENFRRTASLSPTRFCPLPSLAVHENVGTDSKKHRKPTKFRKSLLTVRTNAKHFPRNYDNPNENNSSKSSGTLLSNLSDEDGEGDDECSDEAS